MLKIKNKAAKYFFQKKLVELRNISTLAQIL